MPVERVVTTAFVISGTCAALAAIIYTSRIETGTPVLAQNLLLDIIGLGGVHQRDSGEIMLGGTHYRPRVPRDAEDAGIAFIQKELNIFANLSVEENLLMGRFPQLGKWLPVISFGRLRERARQLLTAVDLNVSPQASASTLSPGERQLVEIAKALSLNAKIIIFDEPTTSLTSRESERLFARIGRLRHQGIGIMA